MALVVVPGLDPLAGPDVAGKRQVSDGAGPVRMRVLDVASRAEG
jgi:hypothetical protein